MIVAKDESWDYAPTESNSKYNVNIPDDLGHKLVLAEKQMKRVQAKIRAYLAQNNIVNG